MIDEFQDTSRMQWENFRLLLLEGLSQGADSLIVGDVKQSIYRWRNSDWEILNSLGHESGNPKGQGFSSPLPVPVRIETLRTNRRSETRIIQFNNALFPAAAEWLNNLHLDVVLLFNHIFFKRNGISDSLSYCTKSHNYDFTFIHKYP